MGNFTGAYPNPISAKITLLYDFFFLKMSYKNTLKVGSGQLYKKKAMLKNRPMNSRFSTTIELQRELAGNFLLYTGHNVIGFI